VRAGRTCCVAGCPTLIERGRSRCEKHERKRRQAEDQRRGTASQRGYGAGWRRLRQEVLERDGYRCRGCGAAATTVDHVIPRVRGGRATFENLVASCNDCNYGRGRAIAVRQARESAS
jgi:5-methylcytosine-specific restriction protein A